MRITQKKNRKANQPYDTSLKGWVKKQPEEVLPLLLPGARYIEDLDIERIKPPMRVDRVFKIWYHGKVHIFHLEFQTSKDEEMESRMLVYNALLHYEYQLPVISMIVYPFPVEKMASSPFRVMSDEEKLIEFHFLILPLFTLSAERYLEAHVTEMYPLLPAMQGANTEVIEQAMEELATLYRADETALSQQFTWMQILLERTKMLSKQEKATLGEKLKKLHLCFELALEADLEHFLSCFPIDFSVVKLSIYSQILSI